MTEFDSALLHRLHSIQSRSPTYSGRSGPFGMAKLRPDPLDDDDAEIETPVIEGVIFSYSTVMEYKGGLINLHPGCVSKSLASGGNVRLCVDHDQSAVLADKHSGLSIIETDTGLVFRCDVANSKNPLALLG